MKKYLSFFKIALKKSLEYRVRLLIWFFWDIGTSLIMLFFWLAVFKTKNEVAGYNFSSMAIYYFVIMFSRSLVLTHQDEDLQREIYSGQINIYLPRPANLIILKFFYELAYKFLKLIYLIPVMIISYFIFLKGKEFTFSFTTINILFFFLSCSIAFCLYYFIKILIGISAFWFNEIEWLTGFEELIFWFFGGLLLPLNILPLKMQRIADFLPFKYIFYLPAQGLLGKLNSGQMLFSLLIQIFWLVLFYFLVKKVYQAGLKIYSSFGG